MLQRLPMFKKILSFQRTFSLAGFEDHHKLLLSVCNPLDLVFTMKQYAQYITRMHKVNKP